MVQIVAGGHNNVSFLRDSNDDNSNNHDDVDDDDDEVGLSEDV